MIIRILMLAWMLLLGGAQGALAQALSFGPGQTAIVVGSVSAAAVDLQGNPLQASLSSPAVGNVFIPIISSDPTVLIVDNGGVTILDGQTSSIVTATALQLGSSTLTATFEATQVQASVEVVTSLPVPTVPGASIWLLLPGLGVVGSFALRGRAATPS